MLKVKDANLVIPRGGDESSIVGMWHELDREDVCSVTCSDGGAESELRGGVVGLISVDVEMLIIGSRSEETT